MVAGEHLVNLAKNSKSYDDNKPKDNILISHLKKKFREDKFRLYDYTIHPSGAYYICSKQEALLMILTRLLGDVYVDAGIKLPIRHTFELGHAIHDRMQNNWFRDILLGKWDCPIHSVEAESDYPFLGVCCDEAVYREHNFLLFYKSNFDYSCKIDGFIGMPDNTIQIVEFKTISKKGIDPLSKPKKEHRLQTSLYRDIISTVDPGIKLHPKIRVFYISKGWHPVDEIPPFKEFEIDADESEVRIFKKKLEYINSLCKEVISREKPASVLGCDCLSCRTVEVKIDNKTITLRSALKIAEEKLNE